MFSILDAAKLSGIEAQTLRNWLAAGQLQSHTRQGTGRGLAHQFRLTQVVGLCVGGKLRRFPQGCVPAYICDIVAAFGKTPQLTLSNQFEAGNVFFIRVHHGRPLLSGYAAGWGWPNVEEIFSDVRTFALEKETAK